MENNIRMPKAPCLGCPDRNEHCHSSCKRYSSFVRRAEIWREYIQQQKMPDVYRREHTNEQSRFRRKR